MKTFEKAFKLPFRADDFSSWIYDAEGRVCVEFIEDINSEHSDLILASINGIRPIKNPKASSTFNPESGTITIRTKEGIDKEVLRVRAWGYLTGTGGLHLPEEEAAEIQDSLGRFIAEQLTFTNTNTY